MTTELRAPLSGKICEVHIQNGQSVEEDDEALIIEAMKMETSVYVPCDGTVGVVKVNIGDEVEEDDVLALID